MSVEHKIEPAPVQHTETPQPRLSEDSHAPVAAAKAERLQEDAKNGDIGAAWLAGYDGPRPQIDDESNSLVRKRIDTFLMPICFYIYFCQQLDKNSVSFASVFGFKTDANLQ